MNRTPTLIGVGELVYDHVFRRECDGTKTYLGSRGGGSIFNFLANASFHGADAVAIGVGGEDQFGEAALDELAELGVDVRGIRLVPGKNTRIIFETLHAQPSDQEGSIHEFSMLCPVCNHRAREELLAKIRASDLGLALERTNGDFVCFDRLTPKREELARTLREKRIRTALDIGRVDYLRWFPAARIVYALSAFDIVFIPETAATSLVRRAGFRGIESLSRIGSPLFMYVSLGPRGMRLYDNRAKVDTSPEFYSPTRTDAVIDDAGAGDAFFAKLLLELAKLVLTGKQLENCESAVIAKINKEVILGLDSVLSSYGARGHIPATHPNPLPMLKKDWEGKSLELIQGDMDLEKGCPFCGARGLPSLRVKTSRRRKPASLSKQNVLHLLKRSFFTVDRSEAISQCQAIFKQEGTAYCVGTGGSYAVSVFVSMLLGLHSKIFAQPIRPFDYIRLGSYSTHLIVVSYSGSTSDCGEVIKRGRELGVPCIILVTGSPEPELASLLRTGDSIISYSRRLKPGEKARRERGFVSLAGTVAPCALWAASQMGALTMMQFAQNIETNNFDPESRKHLSERLREGQALSVIGGGLAWPAMLDFESKFVESGLGRVLLHESKDFSHGRFISVLDKPESNPVIVFTAGAMHRYEEALWRTVNNGRLAIHISSIHQGILGALELLIKNQFLVQQIGEDLDRDISKPKIPRPGLALYHWRRLLK